MLELLQSGAIREAVLLAALRQDIIGDVANGDVAKAISQQVSVVGRFFFKLLNRLARDLNHA